VTGNEQLDVGDDVGGGRDSRHDGNPFFFHVSRAKFTSSRRRHNWQEEKKKVLLVYEFHKRRSHQLKRLLATQAQKINNSSPSAGNFSFRLPEKRPTPFSSSSARDESTGKAPFQEIFPYVRGAEDGHQGCGRLGGGEMKLPADGKSDHDDRK